MAKGLSSYKVSFVAVKDMTLGEVFGLEEIPATQIMKKVWDLIKSKGLKVSAPKATEVKPETTIPEVAPSVPPQQNPVE